jgi:hypothetical protein
MSTTRILNVAAQSHGQQGAITITVSGDACVGHGALSDMPLNLQNLTLINSLFRFFSTLIVIMNPPRSPHCSICHCIQTCQKMLQFDGVQHCQMKKSEGI